MHAEGGLDMTLLVQGQPPKTLRPSQAKAPSAPHVGRASGVAGPAGMFAEGGLEFDVDQSAAEEELAKAGREFVTPNELSTEDIVAALPFQIRFNASAWMTFNAARQFRRYSAYVLVDHRDRTHTAVFEASVKPRPGVQYRRVSDLFMELVNHDPAVKACQSQPWKWMYTMAIDVRFVESYTRDAKDINAILAWMFAPEWGSFTPPENDLIAFYITHHAPTFTEGYVGSSWYGALRALFFSNDPAMVFELSGSLSVAGYAPMLSLEEVGNLPEKLRHVVSRGVDPSGDPFFEALAKCKLKPAVIFFATRASNTETIRVAKEYYNAGDDLRDYYPALASDVSLAHGVGIDKRVPVCGVCVMAAWQSVYRHYLPYTARYSSVVGMALGKLRFDSQGELTRKRRNTTEIVVDWSVYRPMLSTKQVGTAFLAAEKAGQTLIEYLQAKIPTVTLNGVVDPQAEDTVQKVLASISQRLAALADNTPKETVVLPVMVDGGVVEERTIALPGSKKKKEGGAGPPSVVVRSRKSFLDALGHMGVQQ